MDLKVYYQKLRQVEAGISAADVVVVSVETPDGGRAGVKTEVPRLVAARMLVDGKARLANAEEEAQYREKAAEARQAAEQAAAASKVQFTVLSEADMRLLRKAKS